MWPGISSEGCVGCHVFLLQRETGALSYRTLLTIDYLLVSYLIKAHKRFSVACHYNVYYIVDLLLYTLLCSKADMWEYTCARICYGVCTRGVCGV